jgi:Protein of unknown function (DUF2384)
LPEQSALDASWQNSVKTVLSSLRMNQSRIIFSIAMNSTQRSQAVDPAQVLSKALLRAADALAVPSNALARIIGSSEASISRVRTGGRLIAPDSKEGELTLLLLRVYRSLDALVGGNQEQARSWLHVHNTHLRGVPLERAQRVEGLVDVAEYLDALRGAF